MNFISILKKEKQTTYADSITFKDFITYLENHTLIIIITIVILLLSHGYLLFNNNIGIDTNVFIDDPESNYNWVENGRFGLLIEKSLLHLNSFSLFYVEMLAIIFLLIFCLVTYYTFYKISGKDFNLINLCIPIIGFTHPIWTEQFIFILQIAEIAFSLFLTILAVLFVFKWIIEKKFIYSIFNIVLLTIVIGSYQSFFVIYIALCLFSFILLYENKNFNEDNKLEYIWISIAKLLGTFFISFILYNLIIKFLGCDFNYLNNSMGWKNLPKQYCIKNIFNHFKELLLGARKLL